MKISARQLVDNAMQEVETISVEQAKAALDDENTAIIDIRDIRELYREGKIPGATHAPRGMLEFWVDPDSEYHRDIFSSGKKFILYCAKSHRSALATLALQNMGLEPICHIDGGFEAWTKADMPTETVPKK
ncbi:MAG: rhodanese-like domain-containing protein [Gammaproteobacteria bacterium]|nr:MAG: rhodanese-like domain-containing protein [Gammaproteobacteria bacterium]RLA54069.1 MAG: rhodanese-like domain-containing protein [Gammaproteobacteria bacterium]